MSPYDKTLFQPMIDKFNNIEQGEVDDLDVLIVEKKAKLNCLNIDPNAPQVKWEQLMLTFCLKKLI